MSISKRINQTLSLIGLNINRVPSPLFDNITLPLPRDEYRIDDDKIFLEKLNIRIPKEVGHPLIAEYQHAKRIVKQLNGVFYYSNDGDLKLKIDNVELYIGDPEILFIISEVFANGSYNIISSKQNIVVIDIGMNVATTSLFFSSKKNVEKIYSYELFPATYEKALKNIKANSFGHKILPHQYGLGKEDAKLILPYSTKQKGRMGINGLPKDNEYNDVTMQEVFIKKVSDEVKEIADKSVGKYVVCKIDCEGAEYEIIEDLYNNNLIDKINAYMIEWHYKKPDIIIDALQKNNFTVFYLTFASDVSGMLYATKN